MKTKYTKSEWITVWFWRLFKHSRIFKMWRRDFIGELLFDLERYDIEGEAIFKKYHDKYRELQRQLS